MYVPGIKPNNRYSPRSFVIPDSQDCETPPSRRRPPGPYWYRIACTDAPMIGSPASSVMRPAMTAAAREREIDLLDDLRVRDIQRAAALERTALAEFEADVSGLADADRVSGGRKIRKLIAPFGIGGGESRRSDSGGNRAHLRAAQWRARVGGDDPPAEPAGAGWRLDGRAVARRRAPWRGSA